MYSLLQENSIATDYVTEKLYDAFVAGCVPLYLGAPNIAKLLPDPQAIIDYRLAVILCSCAPSETPLLSSSMSNPSKLRNSS